MEAHERRFSTSLRPPSPPHLTIVITFRAPEVGGGIFLLTTVGCEAEEGEEEEFGRGFRGIGRGGGGGGGGGWGLGGRGSGGKGGLECFVDKVGVGDDKGRLRDEEKKDQGS